MPKSDSDLDDSNGEKKIDFEHEALDSNRFPGWLGEKHRPSDKQR